MNIQRKKIHLNKGHIVFGKIRYERSSDLRSFLITAAQVKVMDIIILSLERIVHISMILLHVQ